MADKEVTVFVVDVSHFMAKRAADYSGTALDWCLEYIWDKLGIKVMASRKTDYIAVIAVGSVETDHAMGEEEAYQHIRVILPLPRRNNDDLRSYTFGKSHVDVLIAELHSSKCEEGDLLSAIIIGIQMITEFCLKLKFKKNLILLTSGELTSDFTDAEAVVDQIKAQNITLSVLGVAFDDNDFGVKEENKSITKQANEANLKRICENCDGVFATFAEVAQSLAIPRIRPVRPVTTFRGVLSIGDSSKFPNTIQINVERYPKTKQGRIPSASKISVAAETRSVIAQVSQNQYSDASLSNAGMRATHQVIPSRSYKLQDGQELADRSQLEKGYKYGKTIVPVSKADEDFLQFETKAGLQILGFLDASAYARYLSMGESSLIVGQKANRQAALALSSLIHSLYESETYALARFVRKDNSSPVMVLLAPNLETDFESLVEVALPFSEDVRQYKFAPLDRIKTPRGDVLEHHRYLPSQQLNSAMGDLMDNMDLDTLQDEEESELLSPESTFNFGVHRISQAIMFRAFHSSFESLPGPRDILLGGSKIPEELVTPKLTANIDDLIKTADVKKVPPKIPNKRKRGDKKAPVVRMGIDLDGLLGDDQPQEMNGDRPGQAHGNPGLTTSIGRSNPARDFEAMMTVDDLVDSAFAQIQPVILEMVQYSLGNQTYDQALESFKVFRQHAIEQEETEIFNQFFGQFCTRLADERADFMSLLREQDIQSISEDEAYGR